MDAKVKKIPKKITGIEKSWAGVSDVWLTAQTILTGVIRWSRYQNTPIRQQNDLQHSYSIAILAKIFLEKISTYHLYPGLDKELILTAFLVHDHGEGELKRDYPYGHKPANSDLEEYLAFCKRYGQLERSVFLSFEGAYLLQYALDDSKLDFPVSAQKIIKALAAYKREEALCFTAIEIWDYLLYALEQDAAKTNDIILSETLKYQVDRLDYIATQLRGFKQEIWTKEIAASLKARIF